MRAPHLPGSSSERGLEVCRWQVAQDHREPPLADPEIARYFRPAEPAGEQLEDQPAAVGCGLQAVAVLHDSLD